MKPKSLKDYTVLVFSLIIPLLIGILGAITTQRGLWYQELIKPLFNPPSWVFGPVWTLLYIFIGIVFYTLYKSRFSRENKILLYILFFIQLFLNGIWTPIFFGMKNLFYAMIVIIVLDFVLIYLLLLFNKFDLKIAFYLWIPYVLWVLFATILTISLWVLN